MLCWGIKTKLASLLLMLIGARDSLRSSLVAEFMLKGVFRDYFRRMLLEVAPVFAIIASSLGSY